MRIAAVLEKLGELWEENPDWRLGQLVYNIARQDRSLPPCPGLFYIEDDELERNIDVILAEYAEIDAEIDAENQTP